MHFLRKDQVTKLIVGVITINIIFCMGGAEVMAQLKSFFISTRFSYYFDACL